MSLEINRKDCLILCAYEIRLIRLLYSYSQLSELSKICRDVQYHWIFIWHKEKNDCTSPTEIVVLKCKYLCLTEFKLHQTSIFYLILYVNNPQMERWGILFLPLFPLGWWNRGKRCDLKKAITVNARQGHMFSAAALWVIVLWDLTIKTASELFPLSVYNHQCLSLDWGKTEVNPHIFRQKAPAAGSRQTHCLLELQEKSWFRFSERNFLIVK